MGGGGAACVQAALNVLTNLTNDNPVAARAVAGGGGLATLAKLLYACVATQLPHWRARACAAGRMLPVEVGSLAALSYHRSPSRSLG
jgi:hypothetical protein